MMHKTTTILPDKLDAAETPLAIRKSPQNGNRLCFADPTRNGTVKKAGQFPAGYRGLPLRADQRGWSCPGGPSLHTVRGRDDAGRILRSVRQRSILEFHADLSCYSTAYCGAVQDFSVFQFAFV